MSRQSRTPMPAGARRTGTTARPPAAAPAGTRRTPGGRRNLGARRALGLRRALGALLLLPALLAGVLLGPAAGTASAHASLTATSPGKGSVVDQAPERVSMSFSEDVSVAEGSVRVLDPDGERADDGKVTSADGGATRVIGMRPGLPDGTYTVTFQVVSADSHPVSGAWTFSIGAPSKTKVVAGENSSAGSAKTLYDVFRYLSYAGFTVLVGGLVFVLACWPRGSVSRPVQRLVAYGWVALAAGTVGQLLVRGAYTTSGKAGDILDFSLLQPVLETRTGAALMSRVMLLVVSAVIVAELCGAYAARVGAALTTGPDDADGPDAADGPKGTCRPTSSDGTGSTADEDRAERGREARDLGFGLAAGGAVTAIGLAATWAMSEHASVGVQAGLAMPLDVVHLLAVACWLGGLLTLLVCLYAEPTLPARAVRRFSALAAGSVCALVATGIYQSWRQVGTWSALVDTTYGQLLIAKVVLVLLLLVLARFSRRRLATTGDEDASAADAQEGTSPPDAEGPGEAAGADNAEGAEDAEDAEDARDASGADGAENAAEGTVARGSDPAPGPDAVRSQDPERAAQLARQQAAFSSARSRRIRDADPRRARLRRTVLAEAAVAAVVLGVTTALTGTEPARTAEQSAAAEQPPAGPVRLSLPYATGGAKGRGTVQLEVTPGARGRNELHLYLRDPGGAPVDVPEVQVAFTEAEKDVGPLRVEPDRIVTGHFSASSVQLPVAGTWEAAVTVRTSEIDQITVRKTFRIG